MKQFTRNQKIQEILVNKEDLFPGESDTHIAYFIDANDSTIMLFLPTGEEDMPQDLKDLNLTCDGIAYPNGTQEIPEQYDENVVLLYKEEDGRITTCIGYEIKLEAL